MNGLGRARVRQERSPFNLLIRQGMHISTQNDESVYEVVSGLTCTCKVGAESFQPSNQTGDITRERSNIYISTQSDVMWSVNSFGQESAHQTQITFLTVSSRYMSQIQYQEKGFETSVIYICTVRTRFIHYKSLYKKLHLHININNLRPAHSVPRQCQAEWPSA